MVETSALLRPGLNRKPLSNAMFSKIQMFQSKMFSMQFHFDEAFLPTSVFRHTFNAKFLSTFKLYGPSKWGLESMTTLGRCWGLFESPPCLQSQMQCMSTSNYYGLAM